MYKRSEVITKKKKRSRRDRTHPRTLKTQQNKARKLEAFYRNHPKLKQKYATFAEWLEIVKLKPVGRDKPKSIVRVLAKDRKKKSVWGM